MLAGSHGLEMLAGLGLAANGIAGSGGVEGLIYTTIGITITIPGLDPLCLLLVGAYRRWPETMDRALTRPRIFVVEKARLLREFAGVPQDWVARLARRRFLSALRRADHSLSARRLEDSWQFFVGETLSLKFRPVDDGRFGLEEVIFHERSLPPAELRPLGMNIRTMLRDLAEGKSSPYIRSIENVRSGLKYQLDAKAFPLVDLDHPDCVALLARVGRT
jgi:hypothetical protein